MARIQNDISDIKLDVIVRVGVFVLLWIITFGPISYVIWVYF